MRHSNQFRLFISLLVLSIVGLSATFSAVAATRWPGGPEIPPCMGPGGSPVARSLAQPVLLPASPAASGAGMGMASFFLTPASDIALPSHFGPKAATHTTPDGQRIQPQQQSANKADSQHVEAATAAVAQHVQMQQAKPVATSPMQSAQQFQKLQKKKTASAASVSPTTQSDAKTNVAEQHNVQKNKSLLGKVWQGIKKITTDSTRQIIAILLVLFFGTLGIHRVFMGGKWWLILLYIITFGGIFGILPLIDLIFLIIDPGKYEGNSRFFGFL